MKRYRVILNGRNFNVGNGAVAGFYTTRWVRARNPELAEIAAVALVKEDETFKRAIQHPLQDPPMVVLEDFAEVSWLEFFRRKPGAGYTFYSTQAG